MSTITNKSTIQRFYHEIFNSGDLTVANEIVANSYQNHDAMPGEQPGRAGLSAFVTLLRTAFPDLHIAIEDQVAEGDKVVSRLRASGTHQADFAGIPASENPISVTLTAIHRIDNSMIQEAWHNWDMFGLLQQMDAIPSTT